MEEDLRLVAKLLENKIPLFFTKEVGGGFVFFEIIDIDEELGVVYFQYGDKQESELITSKNIDSIFIGNMRTISSYKLESRYGKFLEGQIATEKVKRTKQQAIYDDI